MPRWQYAVAAHESSEFAAKGKLRKSFEHDDAREDEPKDNGTS